MSDILNLAFVLYFVLVLATMEYVFFFVFFNGMSKPSRQKVITINFIYVLARTHCATLLTIFVQIDASRHTATQSLVANLTNA